MAAGRKGRPGRAAGDASPGTARRRWVAVAAVAGTLATIGLALGVLGERSVGVSSADAAGWPNVLLVTLDTTRADRCSAFGYERPTTPRLEALLPAAVRFTAAYAPMPMTLPSHATMFTGYLPRSHGVVSNNLVLSDDEVTLAELLRDAGYHTAGVISALPLARRFGIAQGFTDYVDSFAGAICDSPLPPHFRRAGAEAFCRRGDQTAELALEWLMSNGYAGRDSADPEQPPFFLWVHFFDAHAPYSPPPEHAALFPPLGDESGDAERAAYDAEIHFADAQLGKILDYLEGAGLLDDTLLIVAGDHGEGLGDHGWWRHGPVVYEEAVRVPLLVHWPSTIPGGRTVEAPVALVDLAPTVLDLVGVKVPPSMGGARSLAAALLDEAELDAEHPVLLERKSHSARRGRSRKVQGEGLGVRVGAWKYFEAPEEQRRELYDLTRDPLELTNLIDVHPDEARSLAGLLEDWRRATSPPRVAPAAVTREDVRKLRALGYVE